MASMLDGIKANRDHVIEGNTKDLFVPLSDKLPFPIYFRVKVIDHAVIRRQQDRMSNAKPGTQAAVEIASNAAIVGTALTEVLLGEKGPAQEAFDVHDAALKKEFGLPETADAAQVVRAILMREADVLTLGALVAQHSGYADQEALDAIAGE